MDGERGGLSFSTMSDVRWLPVFGFEDDYEVSEFGDVRSLDRMKTCAYGAKRLCKGKPKIATVHKDGYLKVKLQANHKKRTAYVHVIVLEAFVSSSHSGLQACHNDGNRTNNHYSNLRWDTAKANVLDKKRHGTQLFGEDHPSSKLDNQSVRVILTDPRTDAELAKHYRVTKQTICMIRRGLAWRHIERNQ